MVKNFSVPRGTADILSDNTPLWQDIEKKARRIFRKYNYNEVRTPLFEETGLFKRSLGQTSDVVNKQLLELASDKSEGYALRPEGTASVVRAYVANSLDRKESLSKLYYMGPMFRGERPQKGRLRQFHQIGVEVIGPSAAHPYIDAEVIALNMEMLKIFGLDDFVLKINSLGSPADKENFSKILRKQLKESSPNLCADCQKRFSLNILRILDCKNKTCRKIVEDLRINDSYLSDESRAYFSEVKKALDRLGITYSVCYDLVRGLDYYTHTVFEISSTSLGSQDALSAGGRYNHLVSQLGGPEVPAIGFALGIERAILAMPKSIMMAGEPLDVYVIALDDKSFEKAFEILGILRQENIASDMSYRMASMKSQMRSADKSGARRVMIIGENELSKGVVALKNMETGQQEEISLTNIRNIKG